MLHKPYKQIPIVRIHSICLTGDLFGSLHCDCQSQLHHALALMSQEGGYLIYMLDQEGRGIGLENKINAYDLQQRLNLNTIEANQHLGFSPDLRSYGDAIQYLRLNNILQCRLLTNNPDKIQAVKEAGIVVQPIQSASNLTPHNQHYLKTKINELHHNIEGMA